MFTIPIIKENAPARLAAHRGEIFATPFQKDHDDEIHQHHVRQQ
jgi:hypothetical protein